MTRASASHLLTLDEAAAFAASCRTAGRRLVFTNGVFDVLHPGHVRYLHQARALGDVLLVAVNTDRSVRANKGPTRPVHPELERAEILLSLRDVDGVVLFDDDTPIAVIDRIQPDVLVKGADWGHDAIVGRDIVEARGGRVVRIPLADGFSSTQLIRRAAAARR